MNFLGGERTTFGGVDIVASPLLPIARASLSHKVSVSLEFRMEFDQWLLEFFGVVDSLMIGPRTMAVSHEKYTALKREMVSL